MMLVWWRVLKRFALAAQIFQHYNHGKLSMAPWFLEIGFYWRSPSLQTSPWRQGNWKLKERKQRKEMRRLEGHLQKEKERTKSRSVIFPYRPRLQKGKDMQLSPRCQRWKEKILELRLPRPYVAGMHKTKEFEWHLSTKATTSKGWGGGKVTIKPKDKGGWGRLRTGVNERPFGTNDYIRCWKAWPLLRLPLLPLLQVLQTSQEMNEVVDRLQQQLNSLKLKVFKLSQLSFGKNTRPHRLWGHPCTPSTTSRRIMCQLQDCECYPCEWSTNSTPNDSWGCDGLRVRWCGADLTDRFAHWKAWLQNRMKQRRSLPSTPTPRHFADPSWRLPSNVKVNNSWADRGVGADCNPGESRRKNL